MAAPSARLSFAFSSIGHFYMHMFAGFYAVIVVVMAQTGQWDMSYEALFELWLLGSLLVGLGAIPAGYLADRWGATAIMTVFFLGMGAFTAACGLAVGPYTMIVALAGLGLFAAIYHPVGIPWMIRNSANGTTGKVLAWNGLFGTFGVAGAGVIAGLFIEFGGWRSAFLVPGLLCFATGLVMLYYLLRGQLVDQTESTQTKPVTQNRAALIRVFAVLFLSMFVAGLIFAVLTNALPKAFAERLTAFTGDSAIGWGSVFTFVFLAGGVMQLAGGYLADKYSLKRIYVLCWFTQIFALAAISVAANVSIVVFAILAVMVNAMSLPAENMLLSRFAPANRQGTAFGAKFVLGFSTGPLSIFLITQVRALTGDFSMLFMGLGAATALVTVLLLSLPGDTPQPAAAPAE